MSRARRRQVVAVDCSDGWWRAVRLVARRGRPVIDRVIGQQMGREPRPWWLERVRGCRDDVVRLCAPDHRTLLWHWRVPSHDDGEIAGMTRLEVARRFGAQAESLSWGYQVVRRDAEGYSTLLIAAAPRETIERAARLVEEAIGPPGLVAPGALGVHQWFRRCAVGRSVSGDETVVVVEIEAMAARILIEMPDGLAVAREVTLQGLGAGGWRASLVEEVERTCAVYREERGADGSPIRRGLITGLAHLAPLAAATLQERLGVPCVAVSALRLAAETLSVRARWDERLEVPVSLAATLGLALAEAEELANLLPETLVARHRQWRLRQALGATLVRLAVSALMAVGALLAAGQASADHLAFLQQQLADRRAITDHLEAVASTAEAVHAWRRAGLTVLEVLGDCCRSVPTGASLTALSCDQSRQEATLQGTATDLAPVLAWVEALRRSSHLAQVDLRHARRRPGASAVEFLIVCRLQSGGTESP